MVLLFRSKKTQAVEDLYSTLTDSPSTYGAYKFTDGAVPGQRGRKKQDEISALWVKFQHDINTSNTNQNLTKNEHDRLRKENKRLRNRLSAAEDRIRILEKLCKQNHLTIPQFDAKRCKDSGSVSSTASTVVVGSSSSLNSIKSYSKLSNIIPRGIMKKSKSLSSTASSTPTTSPSRDIPRPELRDSFSENVFTIHKSEINRRNNAESEGESELPLVSRITANSLFEPKNVDKVSQQYLPVSNMEKAHSGVRRPPIDPSSKVGASRERAEI